MLAQYVVQDGTGNNNMTIYHINLANKRNTGFNSQELIWVKQDLSEQLIDTYSTGVIYNQSYASYLYDTSGWAIQTDDLIEINNEATSYNYFGEVYTPQSFYYWDNPSTVCTTYCDGGNYYTGEIEEGELTCTWSVETCATECIDDVISVNITNITTTSAILTHSGVTSYNTYELVRVEDDVVIENGTLYVTPYDLEDLTEDTQYRFTVNVTNYYGCPVEYTETVTFTTPEFTTATSGTWGALTDAVEDIGEEVNNGITTFVVGVGTALGLGESGAKTVIWIFLTGLIILGVVVYLAQKDAQGEVLVYIPAILGGLSLVFGMALGWINVWFGVIVILILVGVIYFKLTA